jgi:hypothetical protein
MVSEDTRESGSRHALAVSIIITLKANQARRRPLASAQAMCGM